MSNLDDAKCPHCGDTELMGDEDLGELDHGDILECLACGEEAVWSHLGAVTHDEWHEIVCESAAAQHQAEYEGAYDD